MGTIVYRATKAQAIRDELANVEVGARVLAHRVIGRRLWFLTEQRAGERAGTKWIGLTLIDSRGGEVAVKAMDESCGPCYYDCPLSFLDRADPPVGTYAPSWRMQVRAFHAARAHRRRPMGLGARVALAACVYVLHHSSARRAWEVWCESDGLAFRMTVRQLGRARLLSSTPSLSASPTSPVTAAASMAAMTQPTRGTLA